MKQILMGLLGGILFLSACGGTSPVIQTASVPTLGESTSTSSPILTKTSTSTAAATATASITPLPTIPTFTPTFDVSTIVTVTPAAEAECLPINQTLLRTIALASYPSGQKYIDSVQTILDYLNQGGELDELQKTFTSFKISYEVADITNDGVPDLITLYGAAGIRQTVVLFWCKAGQYEVFPKDLAEAEPFISDVIENYSINDLNKNGIPEILSVGDSHAGLNINLLEWKGETFVDLTSSETKFNAFMANASEDDFELIDKKFDGIPEFLLKGTPSSWDHPGEPLRTQMDTYRWNGKVFSPLTAFSSPQYRFQAIQDGDWHTKYGNYARALSLYQEAIFNDQLEWWSPEREVYEVLTYTSQFDPTPTIYPTPNFDNTEYPRLAAYAYYRIVLLHLVQNHESDATTVYNTLQKKFSNDPSGHPYAEMATAFWGAYQSTHKMYDGCATAIEYAAEHPEILIPVGSDYHGSQSHIYVPADVCPFR